VDDVDELLTSIKEWYLRKSQPYSNRAFYECPICHQTWWKYGKYGKETHSRDCWIIAMNGLNIHVEQESQNA